MDILRWVRAQWDRITGAVAMVAGGAALLAGWVGVANALLPAEQLPYIISGGIGGLYLLGVGATLWLSADLRDEWRHLADLEDRVVARLAAGGRDAEEHDDPEPDVAAVRLADPEVRRLGA